MMPVLTFTAPGLPGYEYNARGERRCVLSPNARSHWSARARTIREDSDTVQLAVHGLWGRRPLRRARVEFVLHYPMARRRDPDNMTPLVKGALDGLVRAGVLLDDSADCIDLTVKAARGDEGYTVTIWPMGASTIGD